jgi:hypothetical protein
MPRDYQRKQKCRIEIIEGLFLNQACAGLFRQILGACKPNAGFDRVLSTGQLAMNCGLPSDPGFLSLIAGQVHNPPIPSPNKDAL